MSRIICDLPPFYPYRIGGALYGILKTKYAIRKH